jgi:sigma-B regulation protein RsbU (phosphoserine phosphatase)
MRRTSPRTLRPCSNIFLPQNETGDEARCAICGEGRIAYLFLRPLILPFDERTSKDTLVRSAIILLLISELIATLGAAAVTLYVFRRRDREKFLLWFGLFSILYAVVLILRNSAFRLGFGQPQAIGLAVDHLISLSTVVPGLLVFESFYGRGWRASLRWLIGIYCAVAAFAAMGVAHHHHSTLILPPGTVLVIAVPIVLTLGYLAGYKPPPLPQGRILFAGMISFFCAFSADRLLRRQVGNWHAGVEPYGFLALVICLWYVTAQRIVADDRRLISLNDEMRAATRIQKTILPREVPLLENADIAVRYAPMADVAGDLYDFLTERPCCTGVLVADVMGHGVPAALIAPMVKVEVSSQCANNSGPASIIAGLNTILCKEAREQYVTATYLYLDTARGIGRHSAGAHPSPLLWRRRTQSLEKVGESGLLLGVRANEAYHESEFHFEAGDRLLLYTDGLVEAENASGESFETSYYLPLCAISKTVEQSNSPTSCYEMPLPGHAMDEGRVRKMTSPLWL